MSSPLKNRRLGCLWSFALGFFTITSPCIAAKEGDPNLDVAWDDASRLLINDSYARFDKIKAADSVTQRLVDFGRAVTLINVQPKTSGNIFQADEILRKIIQTDSSDEVAICAQYYLGRIAQIHMTTPDENLAIQRYTDLIREHPDHPLAQAALAKRALIRIYALNNETPLKARYEEALKESALVKELGARRDYMLVLASASIRLQKPESVTLEHLLQAEACNNFRPRALSDLYVRIGGFAEASGRRDLAISYYEKFLDKFLRDNRRFTIKEKLAALKAAGGKS